MSKPRRRILLLVFVAFMTATLGVWPVIRAPVEPPSSAFIVNDASQLNPIRVSGIIRPTTAGEIADAIGAYLPYQLHATEDQFRRAYPRATEFFALKKRLDPTNKFRNELLDKYYRPVQ